MRLGKLLLVCRKTQGMSKTQLANAIGISTSSIDCLEDGRSIHAHTLAKIMFWLTE